MWRPLVDDLLGCALLGTALLVLWLLWLLCDVVADILLIERAAHRVLLRRYCTCPAQAWWHRPGCPALAHTGRWRRRP